MPWAAVTVAALESVVLRLRMYWTPISPDEAGFMMIPGRGHTARSSRDVWVDRPQGIIMRYRVWDWMSGGCVASVRSMAMLFLDLEEPGVGIEPTTS